MARPNFTRHSAPFNPAEALTVHAAAAVRYTVAAGVEDYDRERHLPRLIAMMPSELADFSPAARRVLVARLARALRSERTRGRAGHWTYDLNRHIGLAQAYAAERQQLAVGERGRK